MSDPGPSEVISILSVIVIVLGVTLIAAVLLADVLLKDGKVVVAILASYNMGALWIILGKRAVHYTHGDFDD